MGALNGYRVGLQLLFPLHLSLTDFYCFLVTVAKKKKWCKTTVRQVKIRFLYFLCVNDLCPLFTDTLELVLL